MNDREELVDQIRAFNRFYTVLQGFLDRDYLDSGHSVTETRLLFELKQTPQVSASQLIGRLRLDKGYVSRMIRGFEEKGLVERYPSAGDGRTRLIQLTPAGRQETERLIRITGQKLRQLIEPLSEEQCGSLYAAMTTIMECFPMEEDHNGH